MSVANWGLPKAFAKPEGGGSPQAWHHQLMEWYQQILPTSARPFIFFHLAKAAGSSLREAIHMVRKAGGVRTSEGAGTQKSLTRTAPLPPP